MRIDATPEESEQERGRIVAFLARHLSPSERAVVAVSGGVDSDLAARLTVEAVGSNRTKLFTVVQQDMEARHLANACQLARDLHTPLAELHLAELPSMFIRQMARDDPAEAFRPDGLLDPGRAKCSMRTVVLSTYQDRGYVVIGTSNRTEVTTGFFLPFGDALCHLAPLLHLYKSQVRALAAISGTRQAVLDQPASAGFWPNQNDLEDLSWWLCCRGPIGVERQFDEGAEMEVAQINAALSTRALDVALAALDRGHDDATAASISGLPVDLIERLRALCEAALRSKRRPLGIGLEPKLWNVT